MNSESSVSVSRPAEDVSNSAVLAHDSNLTKVYQRTMTICVASLFRGNLGHGHRLFLSRNRLSEDHDHMCQKVFLRESWSWSSSFSSP